ncbi:hypothetical protein [Kallotenue papyrolyticum]|uniref:hypothetical protein n=1 Tax=Kallotenue papyrolyticum TaxID=1325125 RepID=UPI000478658B|nr:hypothetical protein [Kallotenue papyrolyticum]
MGHQPDHDDPEVPWRTHASSAGVATRYLDPTALPPATRRRNNALALVLLGGGLLLLIGRLLGVWMLEGPDRTWPVLEIVPGMSLLTIASVFLFFGLWRRIYGLVIPGCILAGLGLGVIFTNLTAGASVLWGLALGFAAIALLGRVLWGVRHTWPLIPAVILGAVGTLVVVATLPTLFAAGMLWVPLLLIGAGLVLGLRRTA